MTSVQDKIAETVRLLQEFNKIDSNLTLHQVYDKYLHPNVLPLDNEKIWQALSEGSVLNIFQFDSDVGAQAAKKIKPTSVQGMSDANGLMRLMTAEKGAETPMEKYIRFKNNISLWYQEMDNAGLTKEEQKVLEPYFLPSYGVPPSQEALMKMLMDPNICNFSLGEANTARKIVGKKQMSKIPELHQKILDRAKSSPLGRYVWSCGVGPQMGYSFSEIHSLAYSFIGIQTIFLAVNWNPIFWNTACLIVNSASLENDEDDCDEVDKKEKTTDYSKLAKAIGDIASKGIKISLIDINKSGFSFEPDEENNEILFGLKGVNKIGGPIIDQIIAGRPYTGIKDFLNRCPLNKTQMVSLIKSGAFDKLDEGWAKKIHCEPRIAIMAYYVYLISKPKKKLNLQNLNGLLSHGLIPDSLLKQKQIFAFNNYLKSYKKVNSYYHLNNECYAFFVKYFEDSCDILNIINGELYLPIIAWDKMYQKEMDAVRQWLKENQEHVLDEYNAVLFQEMWQSCANGTISAWEMESLCFYYHTHELAQVNNSKYGIVDFNTLQYEPEIDYFIKRAGKEIPIFKLYKIAGTIISKNNTKSTVTLLTTSGVVTVKFTKEYYAMFNRQISEVQLDGTKKVVEKGWFTRGVKLLVTGYRREDTFVAKTYKATATHQLYKIVSVEGSDILLEHERINVV